MEWHPSLCNYAHCAVCAGSGSKIDSLTTGRTWCSGETMETGSDGNAENRNQPRRETRKASWE